MTAHKHAENMRLYAEDALTTDKPWLLWECACSIDCDFHTCKDHPTWSNDVEYRRKVKMCRIGEMEFPAPETEPPKKAYYIPNLSAKSGVSEIDWENDELDYRLLCRGMVHLTEEAAEAHAKAIINVTAKEKCSV